MAKPNKKRESLETRLGRPKRGALSTYPQALKEEIYELRDKHEGWGAGTILVQMEVQHGYRKSKLPSINAVNRYLKEKGFVKIRERSSPLPGEKKISKPKQFHQLWEMDAQGAIAVKGVGHQAMINIKDGKSKIHCMAFPVQVKNTKSQPKTITYFWALRLAFEQWGLPRAIQVDKDSVFIDNRPSSPFPSLVHMFLIGLGVKFHFIKVPPPQKQAMVERSHQTIDRQVTMGQEYNCWKHLFQYTNERRKIMNEKLPNRLLNNKPPLQAFPKAGHSGRIYTIEEEMQLIDMKRIYKYLSKCCWYRKVSKDKTLSLDSTIYYLKNVKPVSEVQITFCNRRKKLIFRDAKELIVAQLPIKFFSLKTIMGGTTKDLISMKKKLFRARGFPL